MDFLSLRHARRPGRGGGLSAWAIIGIVAAAVLALGGLAVVGTIVFVVVGLNQWASNK
jgi:hypothetical protein